MGAPCLLKPVYGFPSAASFAAFDDDLTHKLSTRQLTAIPIPAFPDLAQVSAAFVCADCQEVWLLSDPDNAWRGFFLPQAEAVRQVRNL
ncbi:MAG: hypothetical protein EOO63_16140 [Hymenobacter sp.]|nr:MAG: hypothetical protein EOO63_16140 [Hymenobacter sp.]